MVGVQNAAAGCERGVPRGGLSEGSTQEVKLLLLCPLTLAKCRNGVDSFVFRSAWAPQAPANLFLPDSL